MSPMFTAPLLLALALSDAAQDAQPQDATTATTTMASQTDTKKGPLGRAIEKVKKLFKRESDPSKPDKPSRPRKPFHFFREVGDVLWSYFTAPRTFAESLRQITIGVFTSVVIMFFTWMVYLFSRLFLDPRIKRQK